MNRQNSRPEWYPQKSLARMTRVNNKEPVVPQPSEPKPPQSTTCFEVLPESYLPTDSDVLLAAATSYSTIRALIHDSSQQQHRPTQGALWNTQQYRSHGGNQR
uniref:Uncharacterized protein n=1 Tax=Entomoneis paludosa TaxID=265537 RepID=A0A7S2Y594_9STRA|mmetsp:Transcript_18925/g.39190  ORF Transcript_18925/g.39190 Transcript_18925/m.39190 type:complete len:103 (+) Transcript_18925:13-321(+)